MYIPTQEERYSKVAWYTLLMCLVVPSGVVAWAKGELYGYESNLLRCTCAFTEPLARMFAVIGISLGWALIISSVFHASAFYWIVKRCKWHPKKKLTLVVTWGMITALILRLLIYAHFENM